ncbi:DeoR/GlpR family DNA-binding transcription regulator [Thalassobacillus hwangdonensis]|uniref:DeoR/GlpR family DNA-binding transcription regulator n=1 Tax=Thalassobacillus hwangdonensis TaxID=546108 RepID=A0ABW3L333_9BACI
MLTPDRHQIILELLNQKNTVKIQELVEATNASESTIRRDLDQLENNRMLTRIHGGASLRVPTNEELTMQEKSTKHLKEKLAVATYAADLVEDGDCIYLDAGSTTFEMIPHLINKDIIVVTNGLDHMNLLTELDIRTYVLGGQIKTVTRAIIGREAEHSLKGYHFDKCFLGINGVHATNGLTTPDPEEAAIKTAALLRSEGRWVLADRSKFHRTTFAKVADLEEAAVITNDSIDAIEQFKEKTEIKVVTS